MSEYPDLTGTRLGNYRLIRLLGRGRMGVVYLAQDEALLRPTAIKLLSWSYLETQGNQPEAWFLAEARSVARINHPAVVQVYSVAKHGNYCYIAMEYVEGLSGDALVAKNGPLSPIDATQIVLQIAGALHQAHSCNIIHRDVKPANVLIKPDGTAKLGDFGMAVHRASAAPETAAPVGTPHYIAPEMWQGAPATPATDIYALGATYFFLLTGKPLYQTKDLRTLIAAHVQSAIPDPRTLVAGVPPECSDILQRCLAKSPSDRYTAVQDLSWALRGMLRAFDGRTPPVFPVPKKAAAPRPPIRSGEIAPLPPESIEPWMTMLGLLRRPFTAIDRFDLPYQGDPLHAVLYELGAFVGTQHGGTVVLTGAEGSGRTVLARHCQAQAAETTPVSYLDLKWGEELSRSGRTLPRWACSALGAVPSGPGDPYLESLIEHLAAGPQPAILVLDSVPEEGPFLGKLSQLVRAASNTKCMTLVVVASTKYLSQLQALDGVDPKTVKHLPVPALDGLQTAAYLASWIEVAKDPAAPPLLFTPDAALMVCHRAEGNLARINGLATNMLRMAAYEQRRVLPSWYAWNAPDREDWLPDRGPGPGKPPGWPPHDALALLNACREKSGIPKRCDPGE